MKQKKSVFITQAALIAAMYTALTVLIAAFNLASGAVQVRLSEALTVLPVFTPAAVPGLFIGCFLSNLITGCALWDVLFGSLATLLGALGTRLSGKGIRRSRFHLVFDADGGHRRGDLLRHPGQHPAKSP